MIGRRVAVALLVIACLFGTAGCAPDTPAPPVPPTGSAEPEIFAYQTARELVVADGPRVLSRISGAFHPGLRIRFTRDRKYVVAHDESTSELVAVQLERPERALRITCRCREFFPTTGSAVVWTGAGTDTDHAVVRLDLAAPKPEPVVWRALPNYQVPEGITAYATALLATDNDRILWSRTDFHGETTGRDARVTLSVIESDGATRSLGPVDAVNRRSIAAVFGPDGNSVAVAAAVAPDTDPDSPCASSTVTLIDLVSGVQRTTKPLGQPCDEANYLRWDDSSGPTVAMKRVGEAATRWRFANHYWRDHDKVGWLQVDGPIVDRVATARETAIELAAPGSSATGHTLYRTRGGERNQLADNVFQIAAP